MTRALVLILVTCAYACAWGAVEDVIDIPVRNPFWPQDYEGTRHPISLKPRFKIARETDEAEPGSPEAERAERLRRQAAARAAKSANAAAIRAENERWAEASKSLAFGMMMNYSTSTNTQMTITINDRVYGEGDLLSTNFKSNRFTWVIESLTPGGKLKLKPIQYRPIGKNP